MVIKNIKCVSTLILCQDKYTEIFKYLHKELCFFMNKFILLYFADSLLITLAQNVDRSRSRAGIGRGSEGPASNLCKIQAFPSLVLRYRILHQL